MTGWLGDCQYVEVSEFKRNNGIPQQDGGYIVDVCDTIDVKPSDDLTSYIENDYWQLIDAAKQQVALATPQAVASDRSSPVDDVGS